VVSSLPWCSSSYDFFSSLAISNLKVSRAALILPCEAMYCSASPATCFISARTPLTAALWIATAYNGITGFPSGTVYLLSGFLFEFDDLCAQDFERSRDVPVILQISLGGISGSLHLLQVPAGYRLVNSYRVWPYYPAHKISFAMNFEMHAQTQTPQRRSACDTPSDTTLGIKPKAPESLVLRIRK
jgi:hypothetical protein